MKMFWGKLCLIAMIICVNVFLFIFILMGFEMWLVMQLVYTVHFCTVLVFIILKKSAHISILTHKWHAPYRGQQGLFVYGACLDELYESSLVLKHLSLRINSNTWVYSAVCAATFDVHMVLCLIHPPKWQ